MKAKKIIIFLIVAAVLGGGWFLFQNDKQEKTLAAHNTKKFEQIKKAAKTSNSAGLLVMGLALNKFKNIKGYYPKNLTALYPEFIPDKAFIYSLSWEYKSEGKKYTIQRRLKNQNSFASMGPDLKLKIGTSDVVKQQVAAVSSSKQKSKKPVKAPALKSESVLAKYAKYTSYHPSPGKKNSTKAVKALQVAKPDTKKRASLPESSVNFVKKELKRKEKYLLSLNAENLYIWKGNDGIIGFSDIQYPDQKNLTIYQQNSWFEYQNEKTVR